MLEYSIDRALGVDTYLQIVHQTKRALRLGTLEPGDRLPTAKQVVATTAINPNTVLKAYRELEREGLVEARRGLGTFVTHSLAPTSTMPDPTLRADLAAWMRQARAAGLTLDDVTALIESVASECLPETDRIPTTGPTTEEGD